MNFKTLLYRTLLIGGLVTATVGQGLVLPVAAQNDIGNFVVGGSAINVRKAPNTSSDIVSQYNPGELINFDSEVIEDGYRWISYISHSSGERRYVAVGTADGSQSFGSLTLNATTNQSAPIAEVPAYVEAFKAGDFSEIAGVWRNANGEQRTILAEGGVAENPSVRFFNIFQTSGSSVAIGVAPVDSEGRITAGGYVIEYTKAGESLTVADGYEDDTDQSRDRLFMGQQTYTPGWVSAIYYRVDEGASVSTPSSEEQATTDTSSSEQAKPSDGALDKAAILAGDYSSAYGVWETLDGSRQQIIDEDYFKQVNVWKEEQGNLTGVSSASSHVTHAFLPAGRPYSFFNEETDATKDRWVDVLMRGESGTPTASSHVYYRVASLEEAKSSSSASSGQSSSASTTTASSSSTTTKTESAGGATSSSSSTTATKTEGSAGSTSSSSASSEAKANPIQTLYKTVTNRKDLPSTGEAVSVLGLIGVGLLALGLVVLKRKK